MISSAEVITYLKKNLNKNYFSSIFLAGSKPKILEKQSDLDFFTIIKSEKRDEALDNIKNIMGKLIKKHKLLTYSFLRGPIKYKNKALIHFITYTDNLDGGYGDLIQFEKEHPSVLINLLKQAEVIIGKHPKKLIKNSPKKEKIIKDKQHFIDKYKILKEKGTISNRIWIKSNNKWKLPRKTRHPSKYLKNYLLSYYKKHV